MQKNELSEVRARATNIYFGKCTLKFEYAGPWKAELHGENLLCVKFLGALVLFITL